jgi:hypothetical protein
MRVLLWSYVAEITIQISGWANPGFARIRDSIHAVRSARTQFTGQMDSGEMPSENGLREKVQDEAPEPLS